MNIRPFQIILLATFGLLAILAIFLLKAYQPNSDKEEKIYGDQVVVWGSIEENIFKDIKNQIADTDKAFSVVQYYYIDEREFDEVLVNAIAEGRSPDLIILKSDSLVKHRSKLYPIPYDNVPLREIKDEFVDGAEIFALRDGLYAFPFIVDPLVMYWNRDLLSSAGLALPPTTWEKMVSEAVPALTIRDTSRNIIQSAIAFGEYRNVINAKEVIMTLLLQSGSKMVTDGERGYLVDLDKSITEGGRPPLDATLEFYTNFSKSTSPLYTWNRVQSDDLNAFVAEDLAIYFGKGSEAQDIAQKNPNLNFDVAPVPQGSEVTTKRVAADFYGLAIPKAAYNFQGAYLVARSLSSDYPSALFAQTLGMSSANRSVIAQGDSNPYRKIVMDSALYSRGWLDPDSETSDSIFAEMVESIVSNRARVSNAVTDAVRKLSFEY